MTIIITSQHLSYVYVIVVMDLFNYIVMPLMSLLLFIILIVLNYHHVNNSLRLSLGKAVFHMGQRAKAFLVMISINPPSHGMGKSMKCNTAVHTSENVCAVSQPTLHSIECQAIIYAPYTELNLLAPLHLPCANRCVSCNLPHIRATVLLNLYQ